MTNLDRTPPPAPAPASPPPPGKPSRDPRSLGFPVVGIGASAGGLHAFQEVLTHLPADTGMAFVLVPHLDPTHESMMVPILSKSTRMPVQEVTEGLGVESNHVYVIPPNATMILEGGVLRLVPRSKVKHECIDYFMISLANELAGRAIGVVLSGTASDGTEGCAAIKAEGGITFAQDEASAKFPQMPRNAAAAGCIDVVLPPKRIAEELALVSRHPYLVTPGTPFDAESPEHQAQDRQVMSKVFRLLRSATGVDFAHYKQATIRRRLDRRMALRKSEGLNQYFRFLEENPSEVRALHDEVLINVTSFFRDAETYESLKQNVFPRIASKDRRETVRIWAAGCATGEEPYSIAMAFLEYLAEKGLSIPLQIFATDLSDRAIAKARAGVYGAGIKADLSEERLRRFFSPTAGGEFQISKAIRDLCVFAKQDLAKDPPFSRQDLVSCRNVLIYMDATLQDRVITSFHYALKPSGFLVLGTSESVDRFPHLFEPVDKKSKVFSKVPGRTLARLHVESGDRSPSPANAPTRTGLPPVPGVFDLPKEVDRLILDRYVPAGVVVNEAGVVVQFRGDTSAYLRPPSGMPSFSLQKMVREDLFLDVEAALQEAREKKTRVRREGVRLQTEGRDRTISIQVLPIAGPDTQELHFVIVFEEAPPALRDSSPTSKHARTATALTAGERENVRLKEELAASKRYLQSIVDRLESMNEDLRSANEEAVSSNEELLSTNEEIETAKEELQSGNEELNTLNDELQLRNAELGQVNGDWMNLIGSVNMAIAIVDQDLRFRRFTPPAEKLLNVIPSDIGRRITDFKVNLKAPDLERSIRRVIESLATTEEEVEDNAGRWYSMRIRPYRTLDDKIAGAVILWIDIHGLKLAMKQLQQTHALTDGIVETVRDPLIVLDADLRVKKVNRAFREFFRITNEQAVGRPVTELGNGTWDIPALATLLIKLRDEDALVTDFEFSQQFQSIGSKTMLVNARRLRFSEPDEQLILMAMEDVTERRVRERFAEASVLASQTLDLDSLLAAVARLAAQNIGDWACVYILEEDGSVRLAGLAHREPARLIPIKATLRRFVAGFDGSLRPEGSGTLRTGESSRVAEVQDSDLQAAARDDEHFQLLKSLGLKSAMSVPLVVREMTIGALSVFNDHSQQRFGADELALAQELAVRTSLAVDNARHYRSAQQAIREREQFISIASHEFKTPLSVLYLQTDALLTLTRKKEGGLSLSPDQVEMIEKIGRQSERMADLVNNLLDVSAITTGRLQVHSEEMDLRASVLAVVARIEELLARNRVKVSIQGDHPVRGRWDRMRIEQVITNLLTNAVKYGDGKPVTVTVGQEGSQAILTVEDHGIGIPPEAKPKLFKPYERFSPQSSTGLGLGLFIVRQVVEAHGGAIRVNSEVGRGTVFVIELPIAGKPGAGESKGSTP